MTRVAIASTIAYAAMLCVVTGSAAQQPRAHWITAWGTSQHALGATAVSNATVRMIARVTIAGDAVRIRFDNAYGASPLSIGNAYVGLRIQGAALATKSNRQVFFNASGHVTVPAGGSVISDPVPLRVMAQQDLAVSLHIPGADVRPSQHTAAHVTSYLTANGAGDMTADETATPFTATTTSTFWVKSIDVLSAMSTGAIVAFGDSITDGTCSTLDGHDRWEDVLAMRLAFDASSRGSGDAHKAIVNEGIGGNTITRETLQPPPESTPGLERLERDVLSHHGVTHVVLFMGTNDARREASAAQIIGGTEDIVRRVKKAGLKIVGVTMIPRHNRPPTENNTGWSADKTRVRNDVNRWIRTKAPFDAVIDFDKTVKDPQNADLINPPFNCGDGIHPSTHGYYAMGRSVGLNVFK